MLLTLIMNLCIENIQLLTEAYCKRLWIFNFTKMAFKDDLKWIFKNQLQNPALQREYIKTDLEISAAF